MYSMTPYIDRLVSMVFYYQFCNLNGFDGLLTLRLGMEREGRSQKGGVGLQEREGDKDHMPIKAVQACVWGSHIGNTAVPSLDSTVLHHTACTIISMWMLTNYIVC